MTCLKINQDRFVIFYPRAREASRVGSKFHQKEMKWGVKLPNIILTEAGLYMLTLKTFKYQSVLFLLIKFTVLASQNHSNTRLLRTIWIPNKSDIHIVTVLIKKEKYVLQVFNVVLQVWLIYWICTRTLFIRSISASRRRISGKNVILFNITILGYPVRKAQLVGR